VADASVRIENLLYKEFPGKMHRLLQRDDADQVPV
jgi:hypothetical protein